MKGAKATVDRIVGAVLAALMALAVLNVLWQVFTRFVLGSPSSFTEELARYLLIWIGVLGAGYAVGQRAHLALELLPDRLEGRARRVLERVVLSCVVFFAFFVMVAGGSGLVYVQFYLGQTSPSLGWPLGWVYLVVPLSGLLMTFYVVERMVHPGVTSPENGAVGASAATPLSDAMNDGSPDDDKATPASGGQKTEPASPSSKPSALES